MLTKHFIIVISPLQLIFVFHAFLLRDCDCDSEYSYDATDFRQKIVQCLHFNSEYWCLNWLLSCVEVSLIQNIREEIFEVLLPILKRFFSRKLFLPVCDLPFFLFHHCHYYQVLDYCCQIHLNYSFKIVVLATTITALAITILHY